MCWPSLRSGLQTWIAQSEKSASEHGASVSSDKRMAVTVTYVSLSHGSDAQSCADHRRRAGR